MSEISDTIKSVRAKLDLTQCEFAAALGLDPKKRYLIADYETGRSEPRIALFLKIKALGRGADKQPRKCK